ncbi:hypothetical protein BDV27DRAFT_95760 [Aspergillus caelatus]|uniref:Uncharacterized protein n=1 Tax=Aspergillus caelatus TaxID=61420 RepID=A0A5N6ZIC4_9EURO|nr:uncharacterized protein BDV27DRAFT_95760 [Aspergillus caelatus]KAE8357138.1 hypothetical protein BDV27DRAFT_95760 [Aspergillus caelatus]
MAAPFHSHGPHIKAVETTSMFGKQRKGAKSKSRGQNCLISVRKSALGVGNSVCKLVSYRRWADVNLKFFLISSSPSSFSPNPVTSRASSFPSPMEMHHCHIRPSSVWMVVRGRPENYTTISLNMLCLGPPEKRGGGGGEKWCIFFMIIARKISRD